jgi:hypothetical protein
MFDIDIPPWDIWQSSFWLLLTARGVKHRSQWFQFTVTVVAPIEEVTCDERDNGALVAVRHAPSAMSTGARQWRKRSVAAGRFIAREDTRTAVKSGVKEIRRARGSAEVHLSKWPTNVSQ